MVFLYHIASSSYPRSLASSIHVGTYTHQLPCLGGRHGVRSKWMMQDDADAGAMAMAMAMDGFDGLDGDDLDGLDGLDALRPQPQTAQSISIW